MTNNIDGKKGVILTKSKKYDEYSMINNLRKIGLKIGGLTITIPAHQDIGIRNWGKLDYLVHYHSYAVIKKQPKERKPNNKDKKRTIHRRSDFERYRCYVCKGIVSIFRLMFGNQLYICDSEKCDYKTKVITGYIKTKEGEDLKR